MKSSRNLDILKYAHAQWSGIITNPSLFLAQFVSYLRLRVLLVIMWVTQMGTCLCDDATCRWQRCDGD